MEKNRKNCGMTLIELMVAITIMLMLSGVLTMLMSKTFFVNKYALEQGMNTTELQNALRKFSSNVREARQSDAGGYLIEKADDYELIFFSNIDKDPETERVHYYLDHGKIMMGTTEADTDSFPIRYPEEDQKVIQIAKGIANTASQPLFYYYNKNYPEDETNNPIATPALVDQISLIKIDIFANIDPLHVPDTMRMETLVKPRNIR